MHGRRLGRLSTQNLDHTPQAHQIPHPSPTATARGRSRMSARASPPPASASGCGARRAGVPSARPPSTSPCRTSKPSLCPRGLVSRWGRASASRRARPALATCYHRVHLCLPSYPWAGSLDPATHPNLSLPLPRVSRPAACPRQYCLSPQVR